MNKHYYQAFLSLAFLLSSCSRFYAPVLYNNNASYQPKPLSTDSVKSANYVSGGLEWVPGIDFYDNIYMGQVSFDRANTFKFITVAYGAFGYAGAYQNTSIQQGDPNYFDSKSFAGFGGRASASFFIPLNPSVDFRIIGIELDYSNEFGDYSTFRNTMRNVDGFHTDINNQLFSGGLTTEVAWRGRHNPYIHYAIRGYMGRAFGNHDYNDYFDPDNNTHQYENLNWAASFCIQLKKYYFVFERQGTDGNTDIKFGLRF